MLQTSQTSQNNQTIEFIYNSKDAVILYIYFKRKYI